MGTLFNTLSPKYKVGDVVLFSRRTQLSFHGMCIKAVKGTLAGPQYELDIAMGWWNEENLMSIEDWKKEYGE